MLDGSRLGLGGHSFIVELGNDPRPSPDEQRALVTTCLDAGIRVFDTTYYQERVALGEILLRLGRRDEAEIMAWNFFRPPDYSDELPRYTPYEPEHVDVMLAELQTDRVDVLVVHGHDDIPKLRREIELAQRWVGEGKAGSIGLGMARVDHLLQLPTAHSIGHVLAPYNAFNQTAAVTFARAREIGIGTIALSPFVRGRKLDEIGGDTGAASELLLRWVAAQPLVDRVIVSMRKREWVDANIAALQRGPLTSQEQATVQAWIERLN